MFRPLTCPGRGAVLLVLSWLLVSGCGGDDPGGEFYVRDLTPDLAAGLVVMDAVDPGHPTCQALLGPGWHPTERNAYAWTRRPEALIRLPVENTAAQRLVLLGYGFGAPEDPRRLEILVNGYSIGAKTLPCRPEQVAWDLPPHRLRRGLNEVTLRVDRTLTPAELDGSADSRPLGVLVDWLGVLDPGQEPDLDAYNAGSATDLARGRWQATRLGHGAGATCELTWNGASPPRVQTAPLPGGAPEFAARVEVDGKGRGTVVLPDDLTPGCWLLVGDENGTLTAARLRTRREPLDVLLIVVDTLRPDYLGCYGAAADASPAIDALAADGILFEQALCHVPITGPSHANLFTARFPSETRILNNAGGAIPLALPTVAEVLAERGWDTRAAVSISTIDGRWQFGRGFATYDDRLGDTWILRADTMVTRIEAVRRQQTAPRFLLAHFADPHEPYDAHGLVDRKAEVVRAGALIATIPTSTYTPTRLDLDLPPGVTELVLRSDDPFRLRNLGLRDATDVTLAYDASEMIRDSCTVTLTAAGACRVGLVVQLCDLTDEAAPAPARYAREVTFSDRHVGMILDALRAEGRYDETLIVFTSDHGEALGEHGYLGHVETLYDVMMRVPLIVKPPRGSGFVAGERRTDQAALVDIVPTLLGRLGLPPMAGARGRDLLAAGAADATTAVFMETHRPEAERDLYGLRTGRGKIIHEPATDSWEYYDLVADPRELENLVDGDGPAVQEHRDLLLGVLARLDLGVGRIATEAEVDARTAEMLRSLGY